MHKQSFAAIISEQPKTLILGSLPGDISLEVNQYYGHPRNRFWKMIFEIFETEFSKDYEIRKQLILQNKLALWDVPTIDKIIFNGKKSEQLFWKYFDEKTSIEYISLPSTSPANAQFSYERLLKIWKNAII